MRIYMPNLDISKINTDTLIQYLCSTKPNIKIYSLSGIFEFKKDKLYKLSFIDSKIREIIINKNIFLIDNSYFNSYSEQYQLPPDHIVEKVNISQYILRKNARVSLNIERINDTIADLYFLTKEDAENIPIQEDICTFLSHLN